MKTGTSAVVKKELPEVQMVVNLDSDSDDSVVHVPYTKPTPPEIRIADSDDDVENQNDTSQVHNETLIGSLLPSHDESSSAVDSRCFTPDNLSGKRQKSKKKKNKQKDRSNTNETNEHNSTLASIDTLTANTVPSPPKRDKSKKKNKQKSKDPSSPTKRSKKTSESSASQRNTFSPSNLYVDSNAANTVVPLGTGSPTEVSLSTNVNSTAFSSIESVNGLDRTSVSALVNDVAVTTVISLDTSNQTAGQENHSTTENASAEVEGQENSNKKKRKRKKKADEAAADAAKEEFTSFLKTLNLSSNIGMNDKDMQMIAALSPADLTGRGLVANNKRTKILAGNDPSTAVEAGNGLVGGVVPFPPILDSDSESLSSCNSDMFAKTRSKQFQDPPRINFNLAVLESQKEQQNIVINKWKKSSSVSSTSASITGTNTSGSGVVITNPSDFPDKVAISTGTSSFAFVSVVDEAVTGAVFAKKSRKKTSTEINSLLKSQQSQSSPKVQQIVPPSPLIPNDKPTTITAPLPLSSKSQDVEPVITIISDDDSEGEIFTAQELSQVKSNIRLNITGGGHNTSELALRDLGSALSSEKNVNINHHKPNTVTSGKQSPSVGTVRDKNMRYFHTTTDPLGNEEVPSEADLPSSEGQKQTGSVQHKRKQRTSEGEGIGNEEIQSKKFTFKRRRTQGDEASSSSAAPASTFSNSDGSVLSASAVTPSSRKADTGTGFPSSWTPAMVAFYGTVDMTDLSVDDILQTQSDSHRLWRIPVDLTPQRRKGRQFKCSNCNQFGYHAPNRCPEPRRVPKCVMCGVQGHTTNCLYTNNNGISKNAQRFSMTKCHKALCLNCGRRYHNQNDRRFVQACDYCYKNIVKCLCCGVEGHREADCPDSWRRFHSTTVDCDDSNLRQMVKTGEFEGELQQTTYRRRYDQYCSNCARKGHNYYHCDQRKDYNAVFIPTTPYIVQELPLQSSSLSRTTTSTSNVGSSGSGLDLDHTDITAETGSTVSSKSKLNSKSKNETPNQKKFEESEAIAKNSGKRNQNINSNKSLEGMSSSSSALHHNKTKKKRDSESEAKVSPVNEKLQKRSRGDSMSTSTIPTISITTSPTKQQQQSSFFNKKDNDDSDIEIIEIVQPLFPNIVTTEEAVVKKLKAKKRKSKGSKTTGPLSIARCNNFPDCQNAVPLQTLCFKIKISKNDHHKELLRLNEKHGIVKKLEELYAPYDVCICLLKEAAEFHLGGKQFYRARDRISRLVKDINIRKDVSKLLPELFPVIEHVSIVEDNDGIKSQDSQKDKRSALNPNSKSKQGKQQQLGNTITEAKSKFQTTPTSTSEITRKRKSVTPTPESSLGPNSNSTPLIVSSTKEVSRETEDGEVASLSSSNVNTEASKSNPSQSTSTTKVSRRYSSDSSMQPDAVVDATVSQYEFERKIRKIIVQSARMSHEANALDSNSTLLENEGSTGSRETESKVNCSSPCQIDVDTDVNADVYPKNKTAAGVGPEIVSVSKDKESGSSCSFIPIPIPIPVPVNQNRFSVEFQFPLPHPLISGSPFVEPNLAHDVDERNLPPTERQDTSIVSPNSPFAFNPLMNYYTYQQVPSVQFPYIIPKNAESDKSFTSDLVADSVVQNDSSEFIILDPEEKL